VMQWRRHMPDFIPATGRTLHVVGVCVNRIGIVHTSYFVLKLYDEPLRAYLSRKLLKAKARSEKSESKIASVVKSLADP
jgi:hypothetical protein